MADRRDPDCADRRDGLLRQGGRRSTDAPSGNAWTTSQLANYIGMSRDFVIGEIDAGELVASKFGREYRIHREEIIRYLTVKRFPLPDVIHP